MTEESAFPILTIGSAGIPPIQKGKGSVAATWGICTGHGLAKEIRGLSKEIRDASQPAIPNGLDGNRGSSLRYRCSTNTQRRSRWLVAMASHRIISSCPISKVGKGLGALKSPAAT